MQKSPVGLSLEWAQDVRGDAYLLAVNRSDYAQRDFHSGIFWESQLQPFFDMWCEEAKCATGVVLDIGANFGAHTLYLARHLAKEVWAFEPQRRVYQQLVSNCMLNSLANVWTLNGALSTANAAMEMTDSYFGALASGNQGARSVKARNPSGAALPDSDELIHAFRLDHLWAAMGRPRVPFVKIDVEGHEASSFEGGRELFNSRMRPEIVVFEERGRGVGGASTNASSLSAAREWLRKHGYCFEKIKKTQTLHAVTLARRCR